MLGASKVTLQDGWLYHGNDGPQVAMENPRQVKALQGLRRMRKTLRSTMQLSAAIVVWLGVSSLLLADSTTFDPPAGPVEPLGIQNMGAYLAQQELGDALRSIEEGKLEAALETTDDPIPSAASSQPGARARSVGDRPGVAGENR
jgi:hypothetical protein